MTRRIPHGDNPVEVRKAFQYLAAHTDVITTGPVGAVLIGAGDGVVPAWSTILTTLTLLTVDNITINGAVITSDSGAISFADENLSTTGIIGGVNVTSGEDPGHTHTGASVSGLDISSDTNLAVTAPIVLTDDTISINQAGIDHDALTNTHNLTTDVDHNSITNTHNLTTDIDHALITNTHNLTTDIDHASITNTHNLTTDIDHDQITNYDANKHVDHTGVSISSGTGLTGGGDITSTRTLSLSHLGIESLTDPGGDRIMFWDDVGAAAVTWLTVSTGLQIAATNLTTKDSEIVHDNLSGYDANKHVDHTGVSIATAATSGISGGGTIASTRNLALNINGLTGESAIVAADTIPFYDATAGANRKCTLTELSTALGAADEKVKVDAAATAGYLGVAAGDGVLRTNAQITWADGGNFVTLSCNPGFVDRGDPASFDFTGIDPAGDFICDDTYYDLDLQTPGIIPAGTYAVHLKIGFRGTAAGEYMRFKKKGNSNNPTCFRPTITSANTYVNYEGVVAVDANGKLEYSGTSNLDLIYVVVKGWYI